MDRGFRTSYAQKVLWAGKRRRLALFHQVTDDFENLDANGGQDGKQNDHANVCQGQRGNLEQRLQEGQ